MLEFHLIGRRDTQTRNVQHATCNMQHSHTAQAHGTQQSSTDHNTQYTIYNTYHPTLHSHIHSQPEHAILLCFHETTCTCVQNLILVAPFSPAHYRPRQQSRIGNDNTHTQTQTQTQIQLRQRRRHATHATRHATQNTYVRRASFSPRSLLTQTTSDYTR